MKFIVDNKHREFFASHGWIEFEHLLTREKVHDLQRTIEELVSRRLAMTSERMSRASVRQLLLQGHDLWRDSEAIKAVVCNRTYAEIASSLVEEVPIRLAYDQLLMTSPVADTHHDLLMLQKGNSLGDCSCMQGLLCGLLIALKRAPEQENTPKTIVGTCPWPSVEGNGIFLAPGTILNTPELLTMSGESHLLIVYCRAVARYVLSPADPHTHYLKTFGYSFGDRLMDQHHPVLYR